MSPSFSIVIPSYNYGRFIERAILSVLRQPYDGAVQCIVADGGSQDETVAILKKYDASITWWSRKDKGFVDAVQQAMGVATGEICGILSADDYYLSGAFEGAAAAFRKAGNAGFVAGREVLMRESGRIITISSAAGVIDPRAVLFFNVQQNSTFFRAAAYREVGGMRRLSEHDGAAEIDLWYRMSHLRPGRYIEDVNSVCIDHAGQMTQNGQPFYDNLVRMVESCEQDPRFGDTFRLSPGDRRKLYAFWDLLWTWRTKGRRAEAVQKARVYAADPDPDPRIQFLIDDLLGTSAPAPPGYAQRAWRLLREGRMPRGIPARIGKAVLRNLPRRRGKRWIDGIGVLELEWWRRKSAGAHFKNRFVLQLVRPGRRIARLLEDLFQSRNHRSIFAEIVRTNVWRSEESASGTGSTIEQTATLRAELPPLFVEFQICSMLDAPCGDFNWQSAMRLPERYLGCDVLPELVEGNKARHARPGVQFFTANIIRDDLPSVDLILCRDCLVHLSNKDVARALANLARSDSRYLLATTFPGRTTNVDIKTGGWRPLNLELSPFCLPPPLRLINEKCTEGDGAYADKSLGLWDLRSLRERTEARFGT
jgi:glycosyltransferase involved in cell wall biosynthesis